jgi:TetR/AcrR family transcriptional regulator of autoinduction and epiphytic fitness
MDGEPKSRKKRDTSLKRQAILDGAVKVFTERGFDASSMDRIAEVAGVSKRTVYNHFLSKEILFQTIVADFVGRHDEIKPIEFSKTDSIQAQLRRFIKAELFLIDDTVRRGLSKLLTSTFLMNIEFGKATYGKYQPHSAFISWLEAAGENRVLYCESPELAARIFYGLVEGCLTWNALMSDGDSLENSELLINEIISVFLARYKIAP